MNEKIPHIVDFEKKRLEKRDAKLRSTFGISPDADLTFPQEKSELTIREAIEVSHAILERYRTREILEEDYVRREKEKQAFLNMSFNDRELAEAKKRFEYSMESQPQSSEASPTESLLDILSFHQKNPRHYYGTLLYATAQELLRRFPQTDVTV